LVCTMAAGGSEQVETVEHVGKLTAGGGHQIGDFADTAADGQGHGGGALAVAVGEQQRDLLLCVEGGQGFANFDDADIPRIVGAGVALLPALPLVGVWRRFGTKWAIWCSVN